MLFLAVLFFLLIYLAVSIGVVRVAAKWAKKRNRRPWLWGGLAAFVMYNLVFWDWIPTLVAHKYYCATEAGFWVYKTPEQWKQENPGVFETLTTQRVWPSKRVGGMDKYVSTSTINQRFDYVTKKNGPFFLNLWRHDQAILDSKSGKVLAQQIDFSTGNGNIGGEMELRFWIHSNNCAGGRDNAISFVKFVNQLRGSEK